MNTETKREIVIVGWDGHSHPIRRYRDEIGLPEHEMSTPPRKPDDTRLSCFSRACREDERRFRAM